MLDGRIIIMSKFPRLFSAVIALIAVLFTSLPALAELHGTYLVVQNRAAGGHFCLDASLDDDIEGRAVYIYACHGRYNQRWTFTEGIDNASAVVGLEGRCLDIRGRQIRDNTPVQLYRCHYGANQQFRALPSGQIRELQSGKCLTVGNNPGDRRPVYIDDCDGSPGQFWSIHH